jgi:hypothetical protein
MQEISMKEILDKYKIYLRFTEYSAWSKSINFIDNEGTVTKATLHWDIHAGYSITWLGVPNKELLDMSSRPEFEYVIDCITEGDVQ